MSDNGNFSGLSCDSAWIGGENGCRLETYWLFLKSEFRVMLRSWMFWKLLRVSIILILSLGFGILVFLWPKLVPLEFILDSLSRAGESEEDLEFVFNRILFRWDGIWNCSVLMLKGSNSCDQSQTLVRFSINVCLLLSMVDSGSPTRF